jgi:hypothetical protein
MRSSLNPQQGLRPRISSGVGTSSGGAAAAPRAHHTRRALCHAAPDDAAATLQTPTVQAPAPPPPKTYGQVIRGARGALRRFREARAAGEAPKRSASEPWRLRLEVPLPVASDIADRGVTLQEAVSGWGGAA